MSRKSYGRLIRGRSASSVIQLLLRVRGGSYTSSSSRRFTRAENAPMQAGT